MTRRGRAGCCWDAHDPQQSAAALFLNNINYHIGHHGYPAVPWYNLQKLHAALWPELERQAAVVDRSYLAVFCRLVSGVPSP